MHGRQVCADKRETRTAKQDVKCAQRQKKRCSREGSGFDDVSGHTISDQRRRWGAGMHLINRKVTVIILSDVHKLWNSWTRLKSLLYRKFKHVCHEHCHAK